MSAVGRRKPDRIAGGLTGPAATKNTGAVMMGSRGSKGGGEYDAFSRISRRMIGWKPGEAKALKRAFHHRQRIQPVSLDMYDTRSGGWLHEAENEVAP